MTHAFFKALLFMGAGSVISAMAGTQDINRMGGLRKAMPFTYTLMTIGALALAAFPCTSGFFSKDEILGFAVHRGGFYGSSPSAATSAALLTAFYAFRIVFRVFWGKPVPEAQELEQGHLAHAPPENPLTGEEEDTDVGFPGAEHHIAERDWPMWLAMSVLGFLSIFGGVVEIPGLDNVVENFLAGSFLESQALRGPADGRRRLGGSRARRAISIAGIALAYFVYVRRPGHHRRADQALPPALHASRQQVVLRRALRRRHLPPADRHRPLLPTTSSSGSSCRASSAAAVGVVRGVGVVVRGAQSGFVRAYALLLIGGFAALGLYFLIVSA